jgi:hypothetical protein
MLGLFFLLAMVAGNAFARDALEQRKIDFLIDSVAQLRDVTFVRNGSNHDAQQAADHMRLKLRNAGERVKTAADFIACCATGSSVSGKPYTLEFSDGRSVPSADFLRQRLAEFPGQPAAKP